MHTTTAKQLVAFPEWRAHGWTIPACVLGMMLLAVHAYALGVVMAPLQEEFGWARSQISLGPLITGITALLLAPISGRMVVRYGPRPVALIGVPLWALALASIALSGPDLWTFLACYALLGVANSLVFPTVWTSAVVRRFIENRGLALALTLSGTGIAAAAVPFLGSLLIADFGWRGAYVGLAAGTFVVVYPLVLLLFARSPAVVKVAALSDAAGKVPLLGGEFFSRRFAALAIAMVLYTLATTGLGLNAVPVLMAKGFTMAGAAQVVGLIGIGTIIGRLLCGFLLDLFDARFVAMGSGVAALAAVAILLFLDQTPLTASIACVLLGLSSGAEFDSCAYLASRHFSPFSFATLFGIISGMAGVSSGIAPMIANGVYDLTGSYDNVLWVSIPMFFAACTAFLLLGPYPDLEQVEPQPA